jgi:hypothetical protein
MRDVSSADPAAYATAAHARAARKRPAIELRPAIRLAMVALGFVPVLHVASVATPLMLAAGGYVDWRRIWLSPVLLFLLPPLLVRLSTLFRPFPTNPVTVDSTAFLHWWFSAQCQIVFLRLPFLEELLRLLPGLYSTWLRLWGAKVGALVYWSPGVTILDRPLVRIGSRVVFGVGVRLNPHVLAVDERNRGTLFVSPISIGHDVLVGGYSLLLPGCVVADGEVTPPFRTMHAFSRYEGGRRIHSPTKSSAEPET